MDALETLFAPLDPVLSLDDVAAVLGWTHDEVAALLQDRPDLMTADRSGVSREAVQAFLLAHRQPVRAVPFVPSTLPAVPLHQLLARNSSLPV